MTVRELYNEAVKDGHYSLCLLIEFLTIEKQAIKLDDDASGLDYYFQPRFHRKMNEYLAWYEQKRMGMRR
ncbi:hypothetical protein [Geobacillus virus E2]|uniref:hypothetical protein n=1 Tax=Geobacillus virus E2 TaxID=447909 RepID=UPI00015367FD|nr:hypothetical protein GBVE2_p41 [Geobacillus virus E2]ABI36859.1 hypothetical protein [Geobacillus virus E2]